MLLKSLAPIDALCEMALTFKTKDKVTLNKEKLQSILSTIYYRKRPGLR